MRTLGGWSFRAWGEGRGGQGLSPWHYGLPGGLQGMGPSPASLFFPCGLVRPLARHLLNQSPRPPPACSTGHQHIVFQSISSGLVTDLGAKNPKQPYKSH